MQELIQALELGSLSFFLDEDSGELRVDWEPTDDLPAVNMAMLEQALASNGYSEFQFYDDALTAFVAKSQTATTLLTMALGKRLDGEFSLRLEEDLMTAYLTLIPPKGGRTVNARLIETIQNRGIVFGILHDQLKTAMAAGRCENLIIAQGIAPQHGAPTRFKSLLATKHVSPMPIDESAVTQYHDLAPLLLVARGDRLMRRFPAVTGTCGTNIKGEIVLAEPIIDVPFGAALQGAATAADDTDLLVATTAGQATAAKDGVSVNPVIEVSDVDLSTGNIRFDGSIRVKGDVKAGMQLIVSGDVIINGKVEAAEILAGGNVRVKGGVVGRAILPTDLRTRPAAIAKIRCKGSVQAQFMEHADIKAAESIMVDEGVRQCELAAGNEIIVGKTSSTAGQIIGGRAQAANKVKAMRLGSSAGVSTHVQVGVDPFLEKKLKERAELLQHKLAEMDRVLKLIAYFKKDTVRAAGGIADKVEATHRHLAVEINAAVTEQNLLNTTNVNVDHAQVCCRKMIHEGVEIHIGKQSWQAEQMTGPCIVRQLEGKITAS